MMEEEKLQNELGEYGITLTAMQLNQFMKYYSLLIEWNKRINLTSITDFSEVINKHFVDSLSLIKVIGITNQRIIDVGTGAGFPGIPIKIIFPDTNIVLLDSLKKRIDFLDCVIDELGLFNISTIHGRAEDVARDILYRETFDICVSRAVADLSILSEYCIPFLKKGGFFISYKSALIAEEIENAKHTIDILGSVIEKDVEIKLPFTNYKRCLLLIKKNDFTNMRYPRKAGIPLKRPLK